MRINRFIASSTDLSRRAADGVIAEGRVLVNGTAPSSGQDIGASDRVTLDGKLLTPVKTETVVFHKPAGFVTSREGQGSKTIYDILPNELHQLNAVGRLDKDSSGLLLLTNDGALAQQLTHPSHQKAKIYEIVLDKPLEPLHRQMIAEFGVQLDDGPSKFIVERLHDGDDRHWRITMSEGRNRQIRRTFGALGYDVKKLHRTHFGPYGLSDTTPGSYRSVS